MADVPDIKLIRADTTLELDIWALKAEQRRVMPYPYLLSKIVDCTCLVILFKNNHKFHAMTHNKYIYRCLAKCFSYS